jgi:hypothetical protein
MTAPGPAPPTTRSPGSRSLAEGFLVIVIRPEWMRDYDVTREPRAIEATLAAG